MNTHNICLFIYKYTYCKVVVHANSNNNNSSNIQVYHFPHTSPLAPYPLLITAHYHIQPVKRYKLLLSLTTLVNIQQKA